MDYFKFVWLLFVVMTISVLSFGWDCEDKESYEEVETKTMPFKGGNALFAETQNGGIKIESWEKDSIKIEAKKKAWADTEEEAKEKVEKTELQIKEVKNGIRIETPGVEKFSVSYKIRIPKNTALELKTMNGGIEVKNITGEIKAKTMNGSISLIGIYGEVEAETMNGGVEYEVDTLVSSSNISLNTMNGGICASVPETPELSIYARVQNGKIISDFPIYTQKEQLKTKIKLMLEVTNGGIVIKKK
jgi:DUF4097 and DUF4098 domain-containing protein YvlB